MTHSIGKTIRRLRKEQNLTQEELAEQLNVTSQAVSKWENETGMPDISQIVPLASVLRVSTDVLFGTADINDDDAAREIIYEARALVAEPATLESVRLCYDKLSEGLAKYSNNTMLLMQSLEYGIALSYPGDDLFDKENAQKIYKECIRQANVVISYSKNVNSTMRAHMIMAFLHSAYGNFELAREHAEQFPFRTDMTRFGIEAFINDFEGNTEGAKRNREYDLAYHFEAVLNDMMLLSSDYEKLGDYADAESVLLSALDMIGVLCKDEPVTHSFHQREYGDIYGTLAKICVEMGKTDEALDWIEQMAEFDMFVGVRYKMDLRMQNPILRDVTDLNYFPCVNRRERLLAKLRDRAFDEIRENTRFQAVVDRANSMNE